jgi:hypothetical protein
MVWHGMAYATAARLTASRAADTNIEGPSIEISSEGNDYLRAAIVNQTRANHSSDMDQGSFLRANGAGGRGSRGLVT